MANKNFLLLSMEDEKIKKISNVISNESCRKILDYLSNKEATESELAEKLQIPISTVHYNLQQLMETGLISAEEFHYSQKGKEVSHYRLANKYIIIAPKKTSGIKEKLKSILPVLLVVGGAALVIQYLQRFFVKGGITEIFSSTKQTLVRETLITQKVAESADLVKGVASIGQAGAANQIQQATMASPNVTQELINRTTEYALTPQTTTNTIITQPSIWSNIALWFLLGALFAIVLYFAWGIIRKKPEV